MTGAALFRRDTLEAHDFLGGKLTVRQPREGFRSGVDAVYLAAAAPAAPGETVLDLGGGAGVASFCLASRISPLSLHILELQPAYADLAERNAAELSMAITVHRGNVSDPPGSLRALTVDGVIANPPYFREGSGLAPEAAAKEAAHLETAPLGDWIDCALRRLRPGGWLVMIQRVERLPEMLGALERRAGNVAVKPIAGRIGRPATRVIVKARKGARAPFTLCAPLIEHEGATHTSDHDDYTAEATAILRYGEALDF